MSGYNYLSSLKNKEFLILQKLCDNSVLPPEKEKLEKELKETRLETEKQDSKQQCIKNMIGLN